MPLTLTQHIINVKEINKEDKFGVMLLTSMVSVNYMKGHNELEELKFSNGITQICSSAFEGCESLTTITFSESLKRIDVNAFAGCRSLQTIVLPPSLVEVDCWLEGRGVSKITLHNPSSDELIKYLKQGYAMDFYNKGEKRGDYGK